MCVPVFDQPYLLGTELFQSLLTVSRAAWRPGQPGPPHRWGGHPPSTPGQQSSLLSGGASLTAVKGISLGLISILIVSDAEYNFIYLLAIYISFLRKLLFISYLHFLMGLFLFCKVQPVLYKTWILTFCQMSSEPIFSPNRLMEHLVILARKNFCFFKVVMQLPTQRPSPGDFSEF